MPIATGTDARPTVLLDTSAAIALVLEDHDARVCCLQHPAVTCVIPGCPFVERLET